LYAIAVVRYRVPLEGILEVLEEHRAWLRKLKDEGILIASGPLDPRCGGALLLRLPEGSGRVDLDRLRDADPFVRAGVAQYELLPWQPNIGREDLDRL
jgi:uncharacterized protein YciI